MFRIALISSLFFLVGCDEKKSITPLPFYNTPDFTPLFLNDQQANEKITHQIDSFTVMNQQGKIITRDDLDGKIHVANFFFASCGVICPRMMGHLKNVVDSFKNDPSIQFISYSVTPWSDSLSVLKAYANSNGYTYKNWHLCTGQTSSIYNLARRSYFAEEALGYSKDSTQFLHTEHVVLVDKKRRIRGIYNGTLELDMLQLKEDIKTLRTTY